MNDAIKMTIRCPYGHEQSFDVARQTFDTDDINVIAAFYMRWTRLTEKRLKPYGCEKCHAPVTVTIAHDLMDACEAPFWERRRGGGPVTDWLQGRAKCSRYLAVVDYESPTTELWPGALRFGGLDGNGNRWVIMGHNA